MMINPAVHYTMDGLWVDYNLMTIFHGLNALGDANISDNGANRLGARALSRGIADGYFVIPYTIGDYLATIGWNSKVTTDHPAFREAAQAAESKLNSLLNIKGTRTVDEFHRELGIVMWDYCGMSRNDAGLRHAKQKIREIRDEFWKNLRVLGGENELNAELEKAN